MHLHSVGAERSMCLSLFFIDFFDSFSAKKDLMQNHAKRKWLVSFVKNSGIWWTLI